MVAATLVDVDSGFILDACTREGDLADLELLGAGHADLARVAPALTGGSPAGAATLTVETGDGWVHLLRQIPDPHGDRLALAAVVAGSPRSVARARQRLAAVPVEALTAGPTLQRRPVDGRWLVGPVGPDAPAVTPDGLPGLEPVVPTTGVVVPRPTEPVWNDEPAPPAAMVPVVVTSGPSRWAGASPADPDSTEPTERPSDPDPDDEGEADWGVPEPRQEPAAVET